MRLLFWLLLIMVGAVVLSLLAGSNEGYVLLVQPPYRIELSLNLLIILLVLAFALMHGTLRLLHYVFRLPQHVHRYKLAQRQKKAHAALIQGLHALVEGRYDKAEKSAARALKLGEDAGLSALVAARAAHRQQHTDKRDHYLAEAERLAPEAKVARLLTLAELQLDDRRYADAARTLEQLEATLPGHPPVLRLMLKVQQRLGHWDRVIDLLGRIGKKAIPIEPEYLLQVRQHAYQNLLERHAGNREELHASWKKIPEADRLQSRLAKTAARLFIGAGDGETAAQIVEMSLTRQWDGQLAALYGDCIRNDPLRQLQQAEVWLQRHHGDAGLLLSLGSLCMRQELWGKAQSYLEASLSVQPRADTHLALARLLERRGEQEAAYRHYRASLALALQ